MSYYVNLKNNQKIFQNVIICQSMILYLKMTELGEPYAKNIAATYRRNA